MCVCVKLSPRDLNLGPYLPPHSHKHLILVK